MLCDVSDADFIAFKQQSEGDPEPLPSAEVQLDLKEQPKKAVAGRLARVSLAAFFPNVNVKKEWEDQKMLHHPKSLRTLLSAL